MPLTDDQHVETIEEGEGGEDFELSKSIDYFSSLLKAAKLHLSESISFAARLQARLTKMEARMEDWMSFTEDTWVGATGQQKLAISQDGLERKSSKETSTKSTSPELGALAGPSGAPSAGKGVKPKRRNK